MNKMRQYAFISTSVHLLKLNHGGLSPLLAPRDGDADKEGRQSITTIKEDKKCLSQSIQTQPLTTLTSTSDAIKCPAEEPHQTIQWESYNPTNR